MNPNGFTYISWSNLLKKYVDIQSEAHTLRRLAALEKKGKFRARAKTKNK
jgi:hydroxylamine dehydrogenase